MLDHAFEDFQWNLMLLEEITWQRDNSSNWKSYFSKPHNPEI